MDDLVISEKNFKFQENVLDPVWQLYPWKKISYILIDHSSKSAALYVQSISNEIYPIEYAIHKIKSLSDLYAQSLSTVFQEYQAMNKKSSIPFLIKMIKSDELKDHYPDICTKFSEAKTKISKFVESMAYFKVCMKRDLEQDCLYIDHFLFNHLFLEINNIHTIDELNFLYNAAWNLQSNCFKVAGEGTFFEFLTKFYRKFL